MNLRLGFHLLICVFFLSNCGERVPSDNNARILAMGDSMMAWQSGNDEAIPDILEQQLGEKVIDRSVTAAYMIRTLPFGARLGLAIPQQYRASDWDWVLLTGGGNDLRFGCGCRKCEEKMNELISSDGASGAIPDFVNQIRSVGTQVIYIGYLPSPGVISPLDGCTSEGIELEKRLTRMAAADSGVYFLSFADMVPYGDRSFHAEDMIHPSAKARQEIANRIEGIIRE